MVSVVIDVMVVGGGWVASGGSNVGIVTNMPSIPIVQPFPHSEAIDVWARRGHRERGGTRRRPAAPAAGRGRAHRAKRKCYGVRSYVLFLRAGPSGATTPMQDARCGSRKVDHADAEMQRCVRQCAAGCGNNLWAIPPKPFPGLP